MRLAIAAMGCVALTLTGAQTSPQPYAGTWTADLAGQTYVRLELLITNGSLGGRIGLADIHVDERGDVTQVLSSVHDVTPVGNLVFRDDGVSFTHGDGDDTDHFEMRVAPDGTLRLTFLPTEELRAELARDGIPVPNPIVLKKVDR